MRTAASVANLCQIKDVTEEEAKKIRAIWKAIDRATIEKMGFQPASIPIHQFRRECIDKVLRTCGVEYLGFHKRARACRLLQRRGRIRHDGFIYRPATCGRLLG